MNLTDKTVLITGANGGLGQSLVHYCLSHGAKSIYCCARDAASLATLAERHDAVTACSLDITDPAQAAALADTIGSIDLLINNAGVNSGKRVFETGTYDFDVNVQGTLNVCRAFAPKIAENGALVTVTSILALINLPVMGLYCASKSALHSLTQAIRAELVPRKIDVYELLPGPIDTPMTAGEEMQKSSPDAIAEKLFEEMTQKRYEIYPDAFSQGIKAALENDPEGIMADFGRSIQG